MISYGAFTPHNALLDAMRYGVRPDVGLSRRGWLVAADIVRWLSVLVVSVCMFLSQSALGVRLTIGNTSDLGYTYRIFHVLYSLTPSRLSSPAVYRFYTH